VRLGQFVLQFWGKIEGVLGDRARFMKAVYEKNWRFWATLYRISVGASEAFKRDISHVPASTNNIDINNQFNTVALVLVLTFLDNVSIERTRPQSS